jgi:hypothetical protein
MQEMSFNQAYSCYFQFLRSMAAAKKKLPKNFTNVDKQKYV